MNEAYDIFIWPGHFSERKTISHCWLLSMRLLFSSCFKGCKVLFYLETTDCVNIMNPKYYIKYYEHNTSCPKNIFFLYKLLTPSNARLLTPSKPKLVNYLFHKQHFSFLKNCYFSQFFEQNGPKLDFSRNFSHCVWVGCQKLCHFSVMKCFRFIVLTRSVY